MQNNNKHWSLKAKLSYLCKTIISFGFQLQSCLTNAKNCLLQLCPRFTNFQRYLSAKLRSLIQTKLCKKNAYTNVKPCIPQWPFPSQPFGFDPERRLANMLTLMCRQGARGCYLFKTIDDFTFVQQIRWIYLICLIRLNCVSLGRHEQKGFPVKMEARTLWRRTVLNLKVYLPNALQLQDFMDHVTVLGK